MTELFRVFRYVRPYTPSLLASVVLMAFAGAAHGLIALLIKPIFDRALNPASTETVVKLIDIPFINRTLNLNDIVPAFIHDVWIMTASAVLFAFFLRGLAEIGPVRTAIVSTIEPFWTALLGGIVLGQHVGPRTLAGGLLIAVAVILLQLGQRAAVLPTADPAAAV